MIPLASDTAFFQLLYDALSSLSRYLDNTKQDFIKSLDDLSASIANTARPLSSISHFHPTSSSQEPSSIGIRGPLLPPILTSIVPGGARNRSDLYAWREIFQLYVDSEVFESLREHDRGERDLAETELRLTRFSERLNDSSRLKLPESRHALERFLQLNILILDLKKVCISEHNGIYNVANPPS